MRKNSAYLITLLGVMLSGNPAFVFVSRQLDLPIIAIGMLVMLGIKKLPPTKKLPIIFFAFMLIFIFQSIRDISFMLFTELGFLITLFIAYAMQSLVKDFPKQFVNVMFHLGILSFLFYIPAQIIGNEFKSWFQWLRADLGEYYFHIYIHNFRIISNAYIANQEWRNAGVFWEPGAFSGYLLITLVFLSLSRKSFSQSQFRTRFILLSSCLVTTFSTSGYLIFPLIYFIFYLPSTQASGMGKGSIFILSLLILTATIPFLMELPFMQEKIGSEIAQSLSREGGYGMSRIGGFLFDFDFIVDKPIIGWGPDPTIRMDYSSVDEEVFFRQGNGLTGFVVKFGLLGCGLYFWMVFRSISLITASGFKSYMFILFIALILVNEQYLNYPLLLSMMFLGEGVLSRKFRSLKHKNNAAPANVRE
jgi:hypothetical protein